MRTTNRRFRLASCIAIAFSLLAVTTSAQDIVSNGGFETGDFTDWVQFESASGQQIITSVNPFEGTFAASIFNEVEASNSFIRQVNMAAGELTAGQQVTVSFDARGRYGIGGVAFAVLFSDIEGGGISQTEILGGAPLAIDDDENVWTRFSFTTTAGPDVTGGITLELGSTNGAVPNESTIMFYDNIVVEADTIGGAFVPPSVFTVFRGIELSGSVADVSDSDDVRALYNPGFILNSDEAPVWLIFDANAPSASDFLVESQAGTPGLTYTVEAFNWGTSSFDIISTQGENFGSDAVTTFAVVAADHIDTTGDVRSRVGWRQTGFTLNFPWEVRVDQCGWNQ